MTTKKIGSIAIAKELRELILTQKLKADEPLASVRTLAQSYGVALKTADRALSQLVADDLIYRRQGSGSFVKSSVAREQRQRIIGLVSTYPYLDEELRHNKWAILRQECDSRMIESLKKDGFLVRIISYNDLATSAGMRDNRLHDLDGLLVAGGRHSPQVMNVLKNCTIPVVIYSAEYSVPDFSHVIPDYKTALYDLFAHLQPATLDGCIMFRENHDNAIVRMEAFFSAAKVAGFADVNCRVEIVETNACYRTVCRSLDQLRGKLVVASSDYLAEYIVCALQDNGLEPGVDVELVSFDGFESQGFAPFDKPTLTSIDFPVNAIRDAAVRLLENMIRDNDHCQHIVKVPSTLTIRCSALRSCIPSKMSASASENETF